MIEKLPDILRRLATRESFLFLAKLSIGFFLLSLECTSTCTYYKVTAQLCSNEAMNLCIHFREALTIRLTPRSSRANNKSSPSRRSKSCDTKELIRCSEEKDFNEIKTLQEEESEYM